MCMYRHVCECAIVCMYMCVSKRIYCVCMCIRMRVYMSLCGLPVCVCVACVGVRVFGMHVCLIAGAEFIYYHTPRYKSVGI